MTVFEYDVMLVGRIFYDFISPFLVSCLTPILKMAIHPQGNE